LLTIGAGIGFYLNLPAGAVVAAVIALTQIPDKAVKVEGPFLRSVVPKLDLPGFILFAPAAIMLLLALQYGGQQFPWNSATVIGLFVGAGVMFILFILWEHRVGDGAMIPLAMVRKREIWTSMIVSFLTFGGLILTVSYYLPIYFQAIRDVSPLTSGVYLLPGILFNTLFAVISGILGKSLLPSLD
jgi:Fungal trichothecene efflux pump (TRI12)